MKRLLILGMSFLLALAATVYGMNRTRRRNYPIKPTTRQKIAALENTVAGLVLRVDALEDKIEVIEEKVAGLTVRIENLEQAVTIDEIQKPSTSMKEKSDIMQPPKLLRASDFRSVADTEKIIKRMLAEGTIHSVNVEGNEVRIDPLAWSQLSFAQKEDITRFFSGYFSAKGSTARVTILNNRDDTKLATYSVWSGVKILQ